MSSASSYYNKLHESRSRQENCTKNVFIHWKKIKASGTYAILLICMDVKLSLIYMKWTWTSCKMRENAIKLHLTQRHDSSVLIEQESNKLRCENNSYAFPTHLEWLFINFDCHSNQEYICKSQLKSFNMLSNLKWKVRKIEVSLVQDTY